MNGWNGPGRDPIELGQGAMLRLLQGRHRAHSGSLRFLLRAHAARKLLHAQYSHFSYTKRNAAVRAHAFKTANYSGWTGKPRDFRFSCQ